MHGGGKDSDVYPEYLPVPLIRRKSSIGLKEG